MQQSILVVSCNPAVDKIIYLPTFLLGGIHRAAQDQVVQSAGGKGVNVARMCAQAGANVRSLGFAAGEAGHWIASDLLSRGVAVDYIWLDGETRTNINIISESPNIETEILEAGPIATEAACATLLAQFQLLLSTTSLVVLSGGLAPGMASDTYAKMIRLARAQNIPSILDASGAALKLGVAAGPTLAKPNVRELAELVGHALESEAEIQAACQQILTDTDLQVLVLSRGAKGALLAQLDPGGAVSFQDVTAVDLVPVNTLGCGDAMVAGLACGLVSGETIAQMMTRGMAFAASNALHAEIGFVSTEEIGRYLHE